MDQEYWERFKAGEEAVFNEIYKRYSGMLYAYGIKIIHDDLTVRECIQNLFIYLYDRRSSMKCPRNWTSYLMVSMKHLLYKTQKKTHHLRLDTETTDSKLLFELSIDIQETMEHSDLKEKQLLKLQMALDQLSPQQREVIYLRYYKNLSVDEVAEIIGVSNQVTRNVTYLALQRLRKSDLLSKALFL